MKFYIDLSEFFNNPITTGIQRIAGELCRHFPPDFVIPIRHHRSRYLSYSRNLISAVGRFFSEPTEQRADELRRAVVPERGTEIQISAEDVVLVPEVIIEPARLQFLEGLSELDLRTHRFIVYDLLPMTRPEFFWSSWLIEISRYYRILRRATHCAFISEATRNDFYDRLRRSTERQGVVLPLGSDSLGQRSYEPRLDRELTFTAVGTVEPRKNHELILESFETLLRRVDGLQLRIIGKVGWVNPSFRAKLERLASDPSSGLILQTGFGDGELRKAIERSRATIYISTAEGFGLPPVESLWLGTPVIASREIPSLSSKPPTGIHFLDDLSVQSIRNAVMAFLDPTYANRKIAESQTLPLQTWKAFTSDVISWCGSK